MSRIDDLIALMDGTIVGTQQAMSVISIGPLRDYANSVNETHIGWLAELRAIKREQANCAPLEAFTSEYILRAQRIAFDHGFTTEAPHETQP